MAVPAGVRRRPGGPKDPRPGGSTAATPPGTARRKPGGRRRRRPPARAAVGFVTVTLVASVVLSGCYHFTEGRHFRRESHAPTATATHRQTLVLGKVPTDQVIALYRNVCKLDFGCFANEMSRSKVASFDGLWPAVWKMAFARPDVMQKLRLALLNPGGNCLALYREFNPQTGAWFLTWSWRQLGHHPSCGVGEQAPPVQ